MQSPLLRLKDKNAEESVLIYKSCSPTFYKSTGFSRQIHKDFSTVHLSESGCNICVLLFPTQLSGAKIINSRKSIVYTSVKKLLVYRNFVLF